MHSSNRSWVHRAAIIAGLALFLGAAAPAAASPETIKRSIGNILFAPLDMALAPIVAARIVYTNLQDIDDSTWVRIVYPLPGYVWITGIELGGSMIREVTGLIELIPGLGLIFLEADLDPLFPVIGRGEALVDTETGVLNIKFGMNYTSIPY